MATAKKKAKIGLGGFDLLKGYGIMTVVLFHTLGVYDNGSLFFRIIEFLILIGSAAMPMFMIVSGYGFKPGSIKSTLKKTFTDLLVPYLLIACAYAVICPFSYYPVYRSWRTTIGIALQFVGAFLFGNTEYGRTVFGFELAWNAAAWFFLALFIALNLLNLMIKLKHTGAQAAVLVLSFFASQILSGLDMDLFCIADALWALPFCYLGYILKKHNLLAQLLTCKWAYAALVPLIALNPDFLPLDIAPGLITEILALIHECALGLLTILLGILIGRIQWRILDPLKNVGMYSYWILAIHSVEMGALPWYLLVEFLPDHMVLGFITELSIRVFIIFAFCLLLKQITKLNYKRRLAQHGQPRIHS